MAEACHLVEDREGVAHTSVCLLCDDVEGCRFVGDAFLLRHVLEVSHDVLNGHPLEIVDLTTGEDGGQQLVLLCGGEDEDGVCRRFLECLEEGVEGCCGKHVNLIDDEDFVLADLWRDVDLLDELSDVVHTVVGGCIEFVDVVGPLLVKGLAGFALFAGVSVGLGIEAVDGFRKDACTGGLTYSAWSAEEVGMCQTS